MPLGLIPSLLPLPPCLQSPAMPMPMRLLSLAAHIACSFPVLPCFTCCCDTCPDAGLAEAAAIAALPCLLE